MDEQMDGRTYRKKMLLSYTLIMWGNRVYQVWLNLLSGLGG